MDRLQYDMKGNLITRLRELVNLPDQQEIPDFILETARNKLNIELESTFSNLVTQVLD